MNGPALLPDVSLSEQVYTELKSRLMLGAYRPGDRLSMRRLATEFGTSAMPVREALKRLASERVLESAAAKAFNVPRLSDKRAADLFVLRALLEGAALEAAFDCLRAGPLDEFAALCDRMDAHLKLGDFAAYTVDNRRFHFLIYGQADNADMVSMIEQLWMQTGPSLSRGLGLSGASVMGWNAEHKRLVKALSNGDFAQAVATLRADIEWGADFYRA